MTEGHRAGDVVAVAIGAAVSNRVRHGPQQPAVRGTPVTVHEPGDATHG